MHAIPFRKSLHKVILVLVHAPGEVVGDADVQCTIALASHNVDIVHVHRPVWILASARMDFYLNVGFYCIVSDLMLRYSDFGYIW